MALVIQVRNLKRILEASSLSYTEAEEMLETLRTHQELLGAHLLDLITLTNERIAIGMGSRSLSEKLQDYDYFYLLVPQEKWRYWRSRCCQEDVVLKSMLDHIRLLGGRHLREKSYKQVQNATKSYKTLEKSYNML